MRRKGREKFLVASWIKVEAVFKSQHKFRILRKRSSRTKGPGGDDQTLDFAGAFVDFGDAGVAVGAFDGIFAAVTVSAVDLNGLVRHAGGHFAGEEFGHRCLRAKARSRVLLPRGFANEQPRRVD